MNRNSVVERRGVGYGAGFWRGLRLLQLSAGLVTVGLCLAGATPAWAENNTATTIDGTTTDNGGANYIVGDTGANNSLVITNGGQLVNCATGIVGNAATANNNWALVTGAGSVWSNSKPVWVGKAGPLNRMTVANTGMVSSIGLVIGGAASSFGNIVTVTDTGTAWDLGGVNPGSGLVIGYTSSPSNTLNVINGAVVTNISRWDYPNQAALQMAGNYGTLNITNGGKVYNTGYAMYLSGTYNAINVIGTNSLLGSGSQSLSMFCDNATINVADNAIASLGNVQMSWNASTNMQVVVRDRGTLNAGSYYIGSMANSLRVSDTGSVANIGQVYIGKFGTLYAAAINCSVSAVNGGVITGGYNSAVGYGPGSIGSSFIVTNGGRLVFPAGGAGFNVGIAGATNNGVLVRDSGYFRCWGTMTIAGLSNYVSILNNSTWDGSLTTPNIGTAAGDFGNSVTVSNNSSVTNFGGTLTIGGSGATNNSLSILNNSLLRMNNSQVVLAGPTNNTLTVDSTSYITNAGGFTLNQPGGTVNLISNRIDGAGGPIWFSGGNLSVGSVAITIPATLTISNSTIGTATAAANIGSAANNNTLNILAGTVWNGGNQALNIGTGGSGNSLNIMGIATNFAIPSLGAAGTYSNRLVISNGGKCYSMEPYIYGANNTLTVDGTNSLLYGAGGYDIFSGTSNTIQAINGGVFTVPINNQVRYSSASYYNIVVTNGGQINWPGEGSSSGSSSYNNFLIAGPNSLMTVDTVNQNIPFCLASKMAGSVGNVGTVKDGGQMTIISTSGTSYGLRLGAVAANCTNNSLVVTNGGVLEDNVIAVGYDATSYSNTVKITGGGILQFTTASPTITINVPANSNAVIFDGGTLAYRGVAGVDLTNNWGTSGVGSTCTWRNVSGANGFRLNNSTATNSLGRPYVFSANLGPTNFARLELINGTTGIKGAGVTIDATGGSILFSNTTATLWGPFTNNGTMTVANSAVTFQTNVCLGAGCGLVWSTNALNQFVTVKGSLTLPASLTLDASAIAPIEGTNTLMLFSVSNGITGSVAGWTVVPKRFTVKMKDGNQVLLAPSQGSMILVW